MNLKNLFAVKKRDPIQQAKAGIMVDAIITAQIAFVCANIYALNADEIIAVGISAWYAIAGTATGIIAFLFGIGALSAFERWQRLRKARRTGTVIIEINGINYTGKEIPKELLNQTLDQLNKQKTQQPTE